MKAIQVFEPHDLRLIDKEIPDIESPDEVLIQIKAVGICGSDVHILHGTSPVCTYPRVIGHEGVGYIDKVGSDVTDFKVGDRVILEPIEYCGECYACKQGRGNVCEHLVVRGCHKDGAFQEYVIAKAKWVHKIPDELPFEKAIMIEPYTIGYQGNSRGNVQAGDVVLIYGAGPAGLIALDVAKEKGATCYISDMNETRLEMAKYFGADEVLNPTDVNVMEEVLRLTNGMGPNVVFDAVGLPAVFYEAIKVASVAGRVVSMGFTDTPAPISILDITKKELNVVGTRHQTFKFKEAITNIMTKRDNIDKLITHVFSVDEYEEAFELAGSRSENVGKVVITF